jgi:DNA-binding CsgD family transcriptional regulator
VVALGSLGSDDSLIGRGPERDVLTAAVDAAISARPTVVWVEGEAGMGKTTLVRDVVARLPKGIEVQQVPSDELATHVPFDLARRLGARSNETFAAGMELLETWSRRQDIGPHVVVIEDLHWADADSALALLTAVQRLEEDRVLVVVTTRPGFQDGWSRFRRDSERCKVLQLCPFDTDEVAKLASKAGVELTPYQAERLRAHTGGHPLYARTLLAELSADDLRVADKELPAPRSLMSAVNARLSELPESARALAFALAVINQSATLPLVGRVAGVEAPVEPLETLLTTGFVRWDPAAVGQAVEFTHPLYRQAIYEDLSPVRRRDLHGVAAQGFAGATTLAHRVAAADGANEALAQELEAEAKRAVEGGNKAVAGRMLQWASSLSVERPNEERRLIDAALAYADAGQSISAEALGARIETFPDGQGRSLVLGQIAWDKGHTEEARQWLLLAVDRHRSKATDSQGISARAWGELAEIHIFHSQAPEAAHAAAQALALAIPHLPSERLAQSHEALADALLHGARSGLAHLRRRLPEEAQAVTGDEVDMLVVRGTLALYAGLAHEALDDLRAVVALARRGFVPVQLARCHRELATILVTIGEFDEALVQARTAFSIAADDQRGVELAASHATLATILAYRGDERTAEMHLIGASESAARLNTIEGLGLARLASAALGLAGGQPDRVIDSLSPLADAPGMLTSLTFWPSLVSALLDVGQLDRAQERIDGLVEAAATRQLDLAARITGLRARWAVARGDLEQGDELFAAALGNFGPDDPFLERVLLRHAHGRVLLKRGARDQGVVVLREVHHELASVGAGPFLAQVESDLESAGARSGRRSGKTSLELTEREHDVAILVAKGYTNPEVAAELYVSRKAIEYHLHNIYGKLGINSRRQLRDIEV